MSIATKLAMAELMIADIDSGKPYTEGVALMAHGWADELRPYGYVELADRLAAL